MTRLRHTPSSIATRTSADIRWAWSNKLAIAGMRKSEEADARAMQHLKEMEERDVA